MFGFTKVCGFFDITCIYLPKLAIRVNAKIPESFNFVVLGALFIVVIAKEDDGDMPVEVPAYLNLNVNFKMQKKRYELYSVIFGHKTETKSTLNHAIAYVKRRDGKWYDTNSLWLTREIEFDQIPLKKEQQSSNTVPLMAFYLRTET